ncbi:DUF6170 family protein [Rheinheimera sp. SA_1]|uniref:DUF6170 family protein n=1 Tax=Rheinheimera sp. SA_1 TaxID=1827365 RepID=UPI000A6ACBF8|nr:DUF6170 family protein [Rheinheimera sp. SA_1]
MNMLYWNSQSLPELKGLNFRERMAVIRRASDLLPVPKKLLLNVLKLLVLIPPFLAIARAATIPEALLWAVLLVLVYPLLTRPLTFLLVGPQLRQARHQLQFTASNSNE